MTIEPIICALIDTIAFLGLSPEDVVNEDAATSQLEEVSVILQQLDDDAKREFVRCTREMAEREQAAPAGSARSTFIMAIPENLGLEMD